MKDICAVLFAAFFVLISLMSLILAERTPDSTTSAVMENQEKVSDLGLRFAFRR
jgi:hypothetical protein